LLSGRGTPPWFRRGVDFVPIIKGVINEKICINPYWI
jgi:hypothetical protein